MHEYVWEKIALISSLLVNQLILLSGLSFGTAGLRAPMGAGFSRLNSLTIMQTSQGLAEFLLREVNGAAAAGVVIGYDARHNSKKFAELAAAAFDVKGINVWLYEDLVHTPLVPFGVKHLHAAAGVMITASHNPAQDNGYKVYGSNGCQINAPMDGQIAASILENLQPIMWDVTLRSKPRGSILTSIRARYLETVNGFCQSIQDSDILKSPLFVYTPMHGVGFTYMASIMNKIGLVEKMVVVGEQAQPDPNFPTVKYPNPEEDGALDLAKSTADRNGISLILANDPDADRFAVAEKIDDEWKQLTGDQVGILLADYLTHKMKDPEGPERKDDNFMLTSAVSSQMLSFVAAGYGISFCETLTGFKWLGNCALDLEHENKRVLLAYEEALGYMFPDIVHDKDGIAAAVVFLNACAEWGSPWAKLEQMYQQYGYFETMNTYWRSSDLDTTVIVFERVRKLGTPFPTSVGDRKVLRWRDLYVVFSELFHPYL